MGEGGWGFVVFAAGSMCPMSLKEIYTLWFIQHLFTSSVILAVASDWSFSCCTGLVWCFGSDHRKRCNNTYMYYETLFPGVLCFIN